MSNSNNKKLSVEEFIIHYKAALNAKLNREQFADVIGITPSTVVRRRLSVFKETGVNLTLLPNGNAAISNELLSKFYAEIDKITGNLTTSTDGEGTLFGIKRFVITSAQNATPPHREFLASLINYCDHNESELVIIPTRYHNLRSVYSVEKRNDEWWHPALQPYLLEKYSRLSHNLVVLANLKIRPSSSEPLATLESYSGLDSAIVGHPKIELKTIATPSQSLPKIFTTTGSVTIANYSDSKEGYRGEFHHSLAAVVVEIDNDGDAHIRHIHADNSTGAFYDLDKYYTTTSVEPVDRIPALITGDTHAEFVDEEVKLATYTGQNSIMKVLKPEKIVFHDVEDFYARNHHHRGNDVLSYGKHHFGRNNVEESLQLTADFIDEVGNSQTESIIVKSNHDEAFDRWLRESDPKADPENAMFYYYMKYNQLKSIERTKTGFSSMDPFEFWCKNPMRMFGLANPDRVRFLKRDEPFSVCGIELGFHGDVGPNGTRGTRKSFAKIGPKTIIGHSHCLTSNHTVLILGRGWVPIAEVRAGDYVLSMNTENNNEYVLVQDTFHAFHTGKLVTVGGNIWRQEVTDYHNMYLSDHTYMPITSAIAMRSAGEVPLTSNGILDTNADFPITDIDIKRMVALCADGSIQEGKWVRFQFKKKRKIERLKQLFGHDLTEFSENRSGSYKCSLNTGSPSYSALAGFMDFSNKRIPATVKSFSVKQKKIFLEELKYWDGTFDTGSNGYQFTTAKQDEADIVSSIITELGFRNTCKLRWRKSDQPGTYLLTWNENKDHIFVSNNTGGDLERLRGWNLHTRDVVDEPVYCLTNKNSNFWVRNETTGTVSLTGNSPGIYEGCYQVGVSASLNLEYVRGCSSWMHTHAIIYPDGSRTLINLINGKWRA